MNIGISGTFTAMNYLTLYGNKDMAKGQENWLVGGYGKKMPQNLLNAAKAKKSVHSTYR